MTSPPEAMRFDPRAVGEEPDPRFTLANERTFLAWTRTALALVASGLAASELLDSQPRLERLFIGVPLVALGSFVAVISYGRWLRVERALRTASPLPYTAFAAILGGCIAAIGAVCLVALVL